MLEQPNSTTQIIRSRLVDQGKNVQFSGNGGGRGRIWDWDIEDVVLKKGETVLDGIFRLRISMSLEVGRPTEDNMSDRG
ncbi:hypothetical protein L6452_35967 [Arctium lappa]|uniref:Uncharacterized protein n=1 Tax=Arctium lappa TaxID=4217 RepID=A0ACB8Y8F5_ARCLA|nr:hypothetical protein L6452_35967 [Arctium lappa]